MTATIFRASVASMLCDPFALTLHISEMMTRIAISGARASA